MKLAFKNASKPAVGSGLVSNFQDSAFNENLFLWDSAFISRFLSTFDGVLLGIETLDNFYHMQREDGLIPREFHPKSGSDHAQWVNKTNSKLHSVFHHHYAYRGLAPGKAYEARYYPDLRRDPEAIPYYTLDNLNHPILAYAEYYH